MAQNPCQISVAVSERGGKRPGAERATLDNTETRMCASQSQYYNAVAKYLLDLASGSSDLKNRLEVTLSKLQTIKLDVLVSHSLLAIALVKATFFVICLTILLCKLDRENYISLMFYHDQSDSKIEKTARN